MRMATMFAFDARPPEIWYELGLSTRDVSPWLNDLINALLAADIVGKVFDGHRLRFLRQPGTAVAISEIIGHDTAPNIGSNIAQVQRSTFGMRFTGWPRPPDTGDTNFGKTFSLERTIDHGAVGCISDAPNGFVGADTRIPCVCRGTSFPGNTDRSVVARDVNISAFRRITVFIFLYLDVAIEIVSLVIDTRVQLFVP